MPLGFRLSMRGALPQTSTWAFTCLTRIYGGSLELRDYGPSKTGPGPLRKSSLAQLIGQGADASYAYARL